MPEPDKLLIARCLKNERKAQLELYQQLFGVLMSMARRYYINREDCVMQVNTAYLKILDKLADFGGNGSFEGWCKRIMTNTLIDAWRKDKRTPAIQRGELQEEQVFNEADAHFSSEEVRHMLLALPETTRYVFNLFALEGYSHKEISEMAGISEGTSRWHVNEARRQLKERIMKKHSTR
jgi:RNA polymerase sigma-70 factor (ECF subfamily)